MDAEILNKMRRLRQVGDSVILDTQNWAGLSHEGRAMIRQFIATMITLCERDMAQTHTLTKDMILSALVVRTEYIMVLRKTYEDAVKLSQDCAFAKLWMEAEVMRSEPSINGLLDAAKPTDPRYVN